MTIARHYLVAIDASENSGWAFDYATAVMDKKNDVIHLMSVIHDPVAPVALTPFGDVAHNHDVLLKARAAEKEKITSRLRYFAHLCHQLEFEPIKMTIGYGHIGDIICSYVKEQKIDFLIMGRRGLGAVQRFFLGSSSKYCIEEAECNVVIVKRPFASDIIHDSSKEEAIAAEEEERKWRVEEYRGGKRASEGLLEQVKMEKE